MANDDLKRGKCCPFFGLISTENSLMASFPLLAGPAQVQPDNRDLPAAVCLGRSSPFGIRTAAAVLFLLTSPPVCPSVQKQRSLVVNHKLLLRVTLEYKALKPDHTVSLVGPQWVVKAVRCRKRAALMSIGNEPKQSSNKISFYSHDSENTGQKKYSIRNIAIL